MSAQTKTDAPTVSRGFKGLPCIKCGEVDCLAIDLHDLTGDDAIRCCQCDTAYSLADVNDLVNRWDAVLQWVSNAPVME